MKEKLVACKTAETTTRRVSIIYTGGTVGSSGKTAPRLATSTSSDLRLHLEKSYPEISYSHDHPLEILSEDATPKTWESLALTVKEIERRENPDSYQRM